MQTAGESRWPGESCCSHSGDVTFIFHLSGIFLGTSKAINSEITYYARAAAKMMYATLLTILCKAQDLLNLHCGTVHTGGVSGIVWILEILNAWYVLETSSHITEEAARFRLLLLPDWICVIRKVVSFLRLLTCRKNKIQNVEK